VKIVTAILILVSCLIPGMARAGGEVGFAVVPVRLFLEL
jgi:hypothetical protein